MGGRVCGNGSQVFRGFGCELTPHRTSLPMSCQCHRNECSGSFLTAFPVVLVAGFPKSVEMMMSPLGYLAERSKSQVSKTSLIFVQHFESNFWRLFCYLKAAVSGRAENVSHK